MPSPKLPPKDVMPGVRVLRRRAEFLAAARARRAPMPGLLVQGRARLAPDPEEGVLRVGFTCSKKIGNAVTRNRAKRRLRAAARAVLPGAGRAGWDYVLVGKPGATVERPFAALCDDLARALERLHGEARS
ncbi:MAG: ribonuclease P protein component [Alphaproteobacteria bacterium HGW-Alphaproteobacteria-2]|nr:MAG: ribonuclease P protein component [Alphaproteobacteria bacterium HGW-Alphaproteobacteria-2]